MTVKVVVDQGGGKYENFSEDLKVTELRPYKAPLWSSNQDDCRVHVLIGSSLTAVRETP